MKKYFPNLIKREEGVTMLETTMLLPWLFVILFCIVELTFYLYAKNVVHYAAFMAARSAVVYGKASLSSIDFPYTGGSQETPGSQMIAEAIAEKIVFESLPWEQKKIKVLEDNDWAARAYYDSSGNSGALRIEKLDITASTVNLRLTYCMPFHFNIHEIFLSESFKMPCKNVSSRDGSYKGIPIVEELEMRIKQ